MIFNKMNLNLDIDNIFDLFKDSYKYIDFRSVKYYNGYNWQRIISIIRFTNETKKSLEKKYNDLAFERFKTKRFEIQHEILEITKWKDKLIEFYDEMHEDIEIFDLFEFMYDDKKYEEFQSTFLDEFKVNFSNFHSRFFFTEEEIKKNNIINFYYSVLKINEHHIQFNKILNEEVLHFGEDNIYDTINRTLQLDGYSSQNGLFISIVFPIYMKIKDLKYDQEILSGKILFHEIFEKTRFFFKVYSNPNYNEKLSKGTEEIVILKEDSHPIKTNNRIFELNFSLDLKKYECDPIFKIRALWEKLPKLFLIDFQKSLKIPLFRKSYEDLREEVIENATDEIELLQNQKNMIKYKNKEELLVPETKFIKQDFIKFGIVHYDSYIYIINRIANDKELYTILPNLLRTLFENILNDIFSTSLNDKHKNLYFSFKFNRIADFSILISLLNQLSNNEYKDRIRSHINEKVIVILTKIKENGNLSVHELLRNITFSDVSFIQDETDLALEALLTSYNKLKDANIEIEDNRLKIIEDKIGLRKKEQQNKKLKSKSNKNSKKSFYKSVKKLFSKLDRSTKEYRINGYIDESYINNISSSIKEIMRILRLNKYEISVELKKDYNFLMDELNNCEFYSLYKYELRNKNDFLLTLENFESKIWIILNK